MGYSAVNRIKPVAKTGFDALSSADKWIIDAALEEVAAKYPKATPEERLVHICAEWLDRQQKPPLLYPVPWWESLLACFTVALWTFLAARAAGWKW